MKKFCENEHCDHPGFKVVRVSVHKPGDRPRTLCAACEEAYTWGVQHGTITARAEVPARPEQPMPTIRPEINDRELATILAALRFHQDENLAGGESSVDQASAEIATDGGRLRPLTSGEVEQLCRRLNCGAASGVKPSGRGLIIDPPPREDGRAPLFRVVYTIDVNAADAHEAAELADLTMTDPAAMPPVLQIMDHRGTVTTIDLSAKENPDQNGGGP